MGNLSTSTRWIWEVVHDCIFFPFISLFRKAYLTLAQNVETLNSASLSIAKLNKTVTKRNLQSCRLVHGKHARAVFTHELLTYQRDAKTNSCLNTAHSCIHSVCIQYTYREIILSAFYFKDFQSAKMINLLLHIVK